MNNKLVVITTYWKSSPGGGVKNYVLHLVAETEKTVGPVTVIAREGSDPENIIIKESGLRFALKTFLRLLHLKPAVIHSHGSWFCLLPAVLYRKLFGIRLVHTLHTLPEKKLKKYQRRFLRWMMAGCDHVTFASNALKKYYRDAEKISFPNSEVTYAGVGPRIISEAEKKAFIDSWGIHENAVILLCQALTVHRKKYEGARLLLSSLRRLQKEMPDMVLLITKSGPYEKELKEYCNRLSLQHKVIFTGNLPDPLLAVAACNIYTHITLAEGGVSLAVLEAMAYGKPIVASHTGGIPEALEHGKSGLLVAPDEESICQAIRTLLNEPDFAHYLGQKAQLASRRFSWKNTAAGFQRLYGPSAGGPLPQDNSKLIMRYK